MVAVLVGVDAAGGANGGYAKMCRRACWSLSAVSEVA